MKTGLIAFHFAHVQRVHVQQLEAIVLHVGVYVVQDLYCVRYVVAPSLFV